LAVQVIALTTVSTEPSSVVSGLVSFLLVTWKLQPGCGLTETLASGASAGKLTCSLVVEASLRSVGTRNVSSAYPPGAASAEGTVTWAEAGSTPIAVAVRTAPHSTAARATVRNAKLLMVSG